MREIRKLLIFFTIFVAAVISTAAAGVAEHPNPVRIAAFTAVSCCVSICAFTATRLVKSSNVSRQQIASAYVSLALLFSVLFLFF